MLKSVGDSLAYLSLPRPSGGSMWFRGPDVTSASTPKSSSAFLSMLFGDSLVKIILQVRGKLGPFHHARAGLCLCNRGGIKSRDGLSLRDSSEMANGGCIALVSCSMSRKDPRLTLPLPR